MNKKAFTLIEILVSVSIFTIIVSMSIIAINNFASANIKSQERKQDLDSIAFFLDTISQDFRIGDQFKCDGIDPDTEALEGCTEISVNITDIEENSSEIIEYKFKKDDTDCKKSTIKRDDSIILTGVCLDKVEFKLAGKSGDLKATQPHLNINLKLEDSSEFSKRVTQRLLGIFGQ